jgi:uncharacterized protein (TIGR03790 family)
MHVDLKTRPLVRRALLLCALLPGFTAVLRAGLKEQVAVVYNSTAPESVELAKHYAAARGIPEGSLIALACPSERDISRADFNSKIRKPLREEFEKRGWWQMGAKAQDSLLPESRVQSSKKRFLVLMRGVPYRVTRHEDPAAASQLKKDVVTMAEKRDRPRLLELLALRCWQEGSLKETANLLEHAAAWYETEADKQRRLIYLAEVLTRDNRRSEARAALKQAGSHPAAAELGSRIGGE